MSEIFSSAVQIPTYSGEIYGTLSYQNRESRSVAILLLSDGGAIDRNGNSADGFSTSDCLKLVARDLASFGITSLRYDKRGTGLSELPAYYAGEMQLDDFVEDAIHAIHYLRDELGYARIVLAGHGEGTLVAMLAAQSTPVDGLITLAASAENPAALLHEQLHHRLHGALLEQARHIITHLRDGCVVDAVPAEFDTLFDLKLQPYLISLFKHEPLNLMSRIEIPTLIIHGNRDLQVQYTDARKLAGVSAHTQLKLIEGMNHVLKFVDPGTANQLPHYRDGTIPLCDHLIIGISAFVAEIIGTAVTHDVEFELESEDLMALI